MSDEGDPFDRLDDPDDRDGDPFERFGEDSSRSGSDDVAGPGDGPDHADGDDGALSSEGAGDGVDASGVGSPAGGPFDGETVPEGSPFDDPGSVFERVDTTGVDPEDVWRDLTEDEETPDRRPAEGERYSDVSKHAYCEQCEYFSRPPDAHCTNETAEILEFLDMETVRLVNCPVVAERAALSEYE